MVSGGPGLAGTAFSADLARTIRLFRAFRQEQSAPDHFYRTLAEDTVAQLDQYTRLDGARLLDVGGGSGYFADALRNAGAAVTCVDVDAGEMVGHRGRFPAGAVLGSALDLPFRTASVDVCFSSNVLEHVPDPERMADEMVRVTKPGGLIYLAFTNWLSPHGGHETSPWHYLGGHHAARRYLRRTGRPPKNRYGRSLYAVSVARALRWARTSSAVRLEHALPRYHPRWAYWIVSVPGLREVATWNLLLVLRRN